MPLAVCATPIGNLADVTLRVLEELACRRDRALRGHTPHAHPARPTRDPGAACSRYHRHNEAGRVAELVPRLVAGERMALVSDAGLPGCQRSRRAARRGALAAGVAVTVLPGPVRGRDGARRERPRRGAVPVRRLPPAQRAGARSPLARSRCLAPPDRRVRVAADGSGLAREPRRRRARAARRRLPRADEDIRGGRHAARSPLVAERYGEPPEAKSRS